MSEGHVPTHPTAVARKPIRVAQVLPWPNVGGTEVATLRLATAVRAHGIESVAFCAGSDVAALFRDEGFETALYRPDEPSYRRAAAFLAHSAGIARELHRRRVELVHCADVLAGFHAGIAGRLARLPVLSHVRCEFPEMSRRDRSFLRAIHRFLFVSRHTWASFALPVDERRGSVLYDGVEFAPSDDPAAVAADVRAELGVAPDAPLVGMVARVAPVKDFATLARAARRVLADRPDTWFVVVGDNAEMEPYRVHYERVRQVLAEADVADRFIFTGFRRDVSRLVTAMDIALLVTHSEGVPLVLIEAMALARPVVATAVGGVPELVEHGRTGLLHAHEDDAALAGAVLSLLDSPADARRLGEAARSMIAERFATERLGSELAGIYQGMLGAGRPAPRAEQPSTRPSELAMAAAKRK